MKRKAILLISLCFLVWSQLVWAQSSRSIVQVRIELQAQQAADDQDEQDKKSKPEKQEQQKGDNCLCGFACLVFADVWNHFARELFK